MLLVQKSQIPMTKFQAKIQIRKPKVLTADVHATFSGLSFNTWDFPGIWNLGFGIFFFR